MKEKEGKKKKWNQMIREKEYAKRKTRERG